MAGKLKGMGTLVAGAGAGLVALGAGMVAPFYEMVEAASTAEESLNKFNAVFGDQAEAAGRFTQELADTVGRSVTELQGGMSSFQAMFVGLNFPRDKAREMSQQMQALALDFASFHNVTDPDAMRMFLAGLGGSGEVFDKFGINIKEAALNQQLLAMGLGVSSANATEQQKVMARLAIITKAMGDQGAVGDAIKTADSYANTTKRLGAALTNLKVSIGQAVLPYVTKMLSLLSVGAFQVVDFIKENQALVVTWAAVGAGAIVLGATLIALGGTVHLLAFAVSGLAVAWGALYAAITSPLVIVLALGAGLAYLAMQIPGLADDIGGQLTGAVDRLSAAWEDLAETFGTAWDGIKAAISGNEMGLAMDIAVLGLQLAWEQAIGHMTDAWIDFKAFFVESWHEFSLNSGVIAVNLVRNILNVWEDLKLGMKVVWAELFRDLKIGFAHFVADVQRGLLELASVSPATAAALRLAGVTTESVSAGETRAVAGANDAAGAATGAAAADRDRQVGLNNAGAVEVVREMERAAAAERAERERLREAERGGNQGAIEEAQAALANAVEMAQVAQGIALENEMARNADQANAGPTGQSALAGIKQAAVGSFSAAEVAGAFGGGPEERTAQATQRAADYLQRMLTLLQDGAGGLLFG